MLRRLVRSRLPICYEFHAADLLDAAEDGIDARMSRHPGMKVRLAEKRAALKRILTTIAREREVLTYQQALGRGLAPA
jgi:hypothetical protein